ncbi:DciA family protein [Acinetobacter thermotolerans]|uniref:DciA family protein n=1 Tax=Acinetobacter thermotolerans TaxID=3151487 RepID=UPI00325BB52B
MSEPVNVFQQTRKHIKTGNFSFLSSQVAAWQKLTKLVQPLLPQPEQWQVVCYQNGVLTLTGENQAMISQLAYLQKQYVSQLSQIHELKDLTKIQVCLRNPSKTPLVTEKSERVLSLETREMLRSAADFINDPKLSQALLRLASNKK